MASHVLISRSLKIAFNTLRLGKLITSGILSPPIDRPLLHCIGQMNLLHCYAELHRMADKRASSSALTLHFTALYALLHKSDSYEFEFCIIVQHVGLKVSSILSDHMVL